MKIQIDTTNKTIKLDSTCKIVELIAFLEKILPEEYKTYKLETNTTIIGWNNPYVYNPCKPYSVWCGEQKVGLQLTSIQDNMYNQIKANNSILNYELVTN